MKIDFFDLKRQYGLNQLEIEDKIIDVIRDCSYIGGQEVKDLEENLKQYLHTNNVITVNSGTDALIIALKSVGVKPGDEVITVPNTAVPTVSAIDFANAKPVFVDIDPDTYEMDPSKIE